MSTRQTLGTLLSFFIFCLNFTTLACAASFVYIENNFLTLIAPLAVTTPELNFFNSLFNDQAIMYFVGSGWIAFACIYSLITTPCGWKGQWARHGDFFINFIGLCFQMSLSVMSIINTLIWQWNYTDPIQNVNELNVQQQLVMGVGVGGFACMLPAMVVLLFQKWAIFNEGLVQQQRLLRISMMVSKKPANKI